MGGGGDVGSCLWIGHFLDYSVAARGAPHQADPVPGEPAGDLPLPELLGMKHLFIYNKVMNVYELSCGSFRVFVDCGYFIQTSVNTLTPLSIIV